MQPATTSGQALQNLQGFQSTEKAPQDILTSQEQTLGVPAAQQQVSGLRQAITNTTNLLNNVAPSVYGRTQNSLVTDAQANAQIGNESAPIQTKLAGLNTSEGNAATDYSNLLSQAGTLAGAQETGQQNEESNLKDIYSALYGQEQDAAANQLAQAQLAEKTQADQASTASGALSPSYSSLVTGAGGAGSSSASYGLKVADSPTSGYYFRDATGNPISALQYAQQSGSDYKGLIQKMADSGDTGAKQYLKLGAPTAATGPYNAQTLALIKDFIG